MIAGDFAKAEKFVKWVNKEWITTRWPGEVDEKLGSDTRNECHDMAFGVSFCVSRKKLQSFY